MSTYEKLLDIIAEHRDIDKATITPDTAITDMGLDSLDMVELIMAIEETFGKTVELDADVKTVGQAAKLVDEA